MAFYLAVRAVDPPLSTSSGPGPNPPMQTGLRSAFRVAPKALFFTVIFIIFDVWAISWCSENPVLDKPTKHLQRVWIVALWAVYINFEIRPGCVGYVRP
jgi:hypothetical protein